MNIDIFKKISAIVPAGMLTSGIFLADFYYTSKIGQQYVNFHSLLIAILLIFPTIGKSFGHPLLVTLAKSSESEKSGYLSSAISFSLLVSAGLTILVLIPIYVYTTLVDLNQSFLVYSLLMLVSNALMVVATVQYYSFVSFGRYRVLIYTNSIAFITNIIGNQLSVNLDANSDFKFMCLGGSSLISVILMLIGQAISLSEKYQWESFKSSRFFNRSKNMIYGQTQSFIIFSVTPIILIFLIDKFYGSNFSVVFNWEGRLSHFLLLPTFATIVAGTSVIASYWGNVREISLKRDKTTIKNLNLILN